MTPSARKRLLLLGVTLLVGSCITTDSPTGAGPGQVAIGIPIVPALIESPADGGALPITRIRARVVRISDDVAVGRSTSDVDPNAPEWTIELTASIGQGGPVEVRIFLELLNTVGEEESVEFSGLVGPVTLRPGQTFEPTDIPIIRGPIANFYVTGLTVTSAPDTLLEGDGGALATDISSSSESPPTVFWTALDSAVVSAEDSTVSGVGPGVGRVVASAGLHADTVSVVVLPAPAQIIVTPTTVTLDGIGEEATFQATVVDIRGDTLPGALVGWTSSDTLVAAEIGGGVFESTGIGAATVTAAATVRPAVSTSASLLVGESGLPDLLALVTVDDPAPAVGDTVRVQIELTNLDVAGGGPLTGVEVTHVITPALPLVATSPGQGTFDEPSGIWSAGDLALGATAALLLDFEIPPGSIGQQVTSSAWVSAVDQVQATLVNDTSAAVFTVAQGEVDVAVLKTVDVPQPLEGDSITFTVSVVNNGPGAVTDVLVFDTLPPVVLTAPSFTVSTGSLSGDSLWTIPSLAEGDTATWTTRTSVAVGAAGNTAQNTAVLRSLGQTDGTPGNDSTIVGLNFPLSALPVVQITAPADESVYDPGDLATFSATATDPEDGPLTGSIVWTSNLDGVLATGGSFETDLLTTGVHTIAASATDLDGGTGADTVRITVALITTPTTLNVPFAATASLPITLSAPAPAGGLTLSVLSSDPAITQPTAGTVFIAGGALSANATLSGLQPGNAEVTISHPQFGSSVTAVSVTAELNVVQTVLTVPETFPQPMDVRLQSQGTPTAAPPGGLVVTLTSTAPACAAVPSSITIGAGLIEETALVSAGGTPDLPCTAYVRATAPSITADSVRVTVNAAPPISMTGYSVGSGLQYGTLSGLLGTTVHGGVTVRIESSDPGVARVSPDAVTPGSDFIDVVVPNGQNRAYYYVQGVEGTTGTASFTASAPGFADGVSTMTVVQPAIDVVGAITNTTTLAGEDPFYARVGVPNAGLTALSLLQAVRAGGSPLSVELSTSDPPVGDLRTSTDTASTVTVTIAPGSINTPVSVATGGAAFFPRNPGQTTLSVSAPGVISLSPVDVTVSTPNITVYPQDVGSGLQVSAPYAVLGARQHGGVTVTVTSVDPTLALVSPDASTQGTASIDIVVPNGQNLATYYVHGVDGEIGTTPIRVTAPGFAPDSADTNVVEPYYDIISLATTTTTFTADDPFVTRIGLPNGQFTALAELQAVRAGATPLTVTVSSDNPGIADLITTPDSAAPVTVAIGPGQSSSPSSVAAGGVALEPISGGEATITARIPGMTATAAADQLVTVTAPGFTIQPRTVGAGLQLGALNAVLGATDHPGVTVRLESADPAVMLVSPDASTPGTAFIDVPVAPGSNLFNYYLQGVEEQTGDVQLRISATGFVSDSATITVARTGVEIAGLIGTTNTFAADDLFQVRTGVPYAQNQSIWLYQPVRAGAPPLSVTVSSSQTGVGLLTTESTPQVQTATVSIPPGSFATGSTVALGGVAFDPLGIGTTTVAVTPPVGGEYDVTTAGTQMVTVSAPAITVQNHTVGAGLQYGSLNLILGSGNHGGVTVTLTSSNDQVLLVSPDAATAGTGSIDIFVEDGRNFASYYVQGVEGADAAATLTVSAPGFTNGVSTVTVVPPALDLTSLNSSYPVTAIDDVFFVRMGIPNANNTGISIQQAVRAGGSPLTATVTSSAPTFGQLVTSAQTGGTVTVQITPGNWTSPSSVPEGGVAIDALTAGTTTISATIPGVISTTPGTRVVTITP